MVWEYCQFNQMQSLFKVSTLFWGNCFAFIYVNGAADFHVPNRWTASINLGTTDALLGNAYNQVPIFHEHEIHVRYVDLFIFIIMQHYG